jgi:hypothetical protein
MARRKRAARGGSGRGKIIYTEQYITKPRTPLEDVTSQQHTLAKRDR